MILTPSSEAETIKAVVAARAAHRPFTVKGGGTREGLGRPVEADDVLSTSALAGITLYEPAELVISARAGTPLADIEAALAANRQRLAFEPMDHRALYGTDGAPTIGAIAACNISGPRRIQAGAARDHLLGLRFVNGRGEIIKSGGRVMKNVTGLDLVKLQCGAHGTLGVITEATFKVLPEPETSATLALCGLADAAAVAALSASLGSPYQVSGAAHLPAGIGADEALTLLRLEGARSSVEERRVALAKLLAPQGSAELLDAERAATLWRLIRDGVALAEPRQTTVWRLSVKPTEAPKIVAALSKQMKVRHFYDWGGGLIWLAVAEEGDAHGIRAAVADGGHAILIRAPRELRARVDVFAPLSPPLLKITAGIKASFDPDRIINPGRMYAGI
ncbi:MAG: glycolate oxidase subunit GlcE [Methylovirgula sp.]